MFTVSAGDDIMALCQTVYAKCSLTETNWVSFVKGNKMLSQRKRIDEAHIIKPLTYLMV